MTISGLSAIIRRAHQDKASLALGLDGDLLLGEEFNSFLSSSADIEESGSNFETKRRRRLCSLIASPWAPISFDHDVIDSATHSSPNHNRFTGVDNILPSCYNVQSPPPAALRVASFCEETLFYMFYGMPRDRMQELAAKELTLSRGWRFHLFLELWFQPSTILPPGVPLAPPSSMMISPARTVENGNFSDNSIDGEQSGISMTENFSNLAISGANSHSQNPDTEKPNDICSYVIFDSNNWCKLRKDLPRIQDDQIESRFSTAPVGTAAFC